MLSDALLRRPWRRVTRRTEPEAMFILALQNYKVHAYLGTTTRRAVQYDAVLDTCTVSSFIRADLLPAGARTKPLSNAVNVRGANSQPFDIKGTAELMVQVGNCQDHVVVYVSPTLAAPINLG